MSHFKTPTACHSFGKLAGQAPSWLWWGELGNRFCGRWYDICAVNIHWILRFFCDLTCANWGIWMYLSGFTGFNVEMLPRLQKVLLHDSLLWAPEAILRDLTRLFASLGWIAWIFCTSCVVAGTESLRMPSSLALYFRSFFLASPICWRLIHHDLKTSWSATEERKKSLSLMAPQAEQMQIVVASSCYCFASVGMLLFNKFAVQDFPLDSWATGGCGQCGHQT